MHARKQLAQVIDKVLEADTDENVESTLVEEYKKLNGKCDDVISKIKIRKSKKAAKQMEE